MKKVNSVEEYISNHANWADELAQLRNLLLTTELKETIKWNAPTYTINNKNVVGIGAFKAHFGLWFFNGALLKDRESVLINAQEEKTKSLRQWRFIKGDKINETHILTYVNEAIKNEKAGKSIKRETKPVTYELPVELKKALSASAELQQKFEILAPYKQKEFALHIGDAKREATRKSRLEKSILLIEQGIGLNDKYKNC